MRRFDQQVAESREGGHPGGAPGVEYALGQLRQRLRELPGPTP
jgi:hypothetical protein